MPKDGDFISKYELENDSSFKELRKTEARIKKELLKLINSDYPQLNEDKLIKAISKKLSRFYQRYSLAILPDENDWAKKVNDNSKLILELNRCLSNGYKFKRIKFEIDGRSKKIDIQAEFLISEILRVIKEDNNFQEYFSAVKSEQIKEHRYKEVKVAEVKLFTKSFYEFINSELLGKFPSELKKQQVISDIINIVKEEFGHPIIHYSNIALYLKE